MRQICEMRIMLLCHLMSERQLFILQMASLFSSGSCKDRGGDFFGKDEFYTVTVFISDHASLSSREELRQRTTKIDRRIHEVLTETLFDPAKLCN